MQDEEAFCGRLHRPQNGDGRRKPGGKRLPPAQPGERDFQPAAYSTDYFQLKMKTIV
jgi:hypothetical protein